MRKTRIFVLSAAVCIALQALLGASCTTASAASATHITNASDADGHAYTESCELAEALNEVFAGDVDLYRNWSCTRERQAPLGSRFLNEYNMFWILNTQTQKTIAGWQCYIYANAVYNKLFGEWIRHGDGKYDHSETVIGGGYSKVSYQLFADAGVRCGAYMRTTVYSSGRYHGSAAHSLIILAYTPETVTYLDGNSDGNGLVRINTRTWDSFNDANLAGRGRYTAHVIQPTAAYYDEKYPVAREVLGNIGNEESVPDRSHMLTVTRGDVSCNGTTNERDCVIVKRHVLDNAVLTEWQQIMADTNEDGIVDARDYLMLVCHVSGKYEIAESLLYIAAEETVKDIPTEPGESLFGGAHVVM